MDVKDNRNQPLDRRSLIVGTAAAAAVVESLEAASPRTHWDEEYDIVLVGFGIAACSAAIEALDVRPDAKILILEKAPEEHAGGNSRASDQGLVIPKDKEAMKRYQRNLSYSNPVPEDLLEFWASELMDLHPWIEERAKEANQEYVVSEPIYEFADLGAKEAVKNAATILPRPGGLWGAFKNNVDKRPVTVWYESPAVDLVQDPDTREVFGIIVDHAGQEISVRARGGVVLACGGYENNDDMKLNYAGWMDVHAFGSPYNTGDGIHMLQRAGADLWHLRNRMNSSGFHIAIKVPDYETAFMRAFRYTKYSWIEVAADDRRFGDETYPFSRTHYKWKQHGHYVDTLHAWVMPVHMIFDENVRKNFSLGMKWMTWNAAVHGYEWSEDNSREIEKGWITKTNSIAELALKLGRDQDQLIKTVTEYNAACAAKTDLTFNRDPSTLEPIVTPPYYAIEIKPGLVCTSAGAKRNTKGEVLNRAGEPIPGLYEAGQLGSMVADLYQNGTYLTEAMISGRSAGRNAVLRV